MVNIAISLTFIRHIIFFIAFFVLFILKIIFFFLFSCFIPLIANIRYVNIVMRLRYKNFFFLFIICFKIFNSFICSCLNGFRFTEIFYIFLLFFFRNFDSQLRIFQTDNDYKCLITLMISRTESTRENK